MIYPRILRKDLIWRAMSLHAWVSFSFPLVTLCQEIIKKNMNKSLRNSMHETLIKGWGTNTDEGWWRVPNPRYTLSAEGQDYRNDKKCIIERSLGHTLGNLLRSQLSIIKDSRTRHALWKDRRLLKNRRCWKIILTESEEHLRLHHQTDLHMHQR
jgi:hypothetical protein